MAEAVEDKVQAERKAREAETRLEERREMARLVEQRIEEERRLIAHELHDEFGQSVTAIRSLAQAIATQGGLEGPADRGGGAPHLRGSGAAVRRHARADSAPHAAVARYARPRRHAGEPGAGLAAPLSQRSRCSVRQDITADLGPSVTLAIYRVVQEGLINALRHAQPSRVDISVEAVAGAEGIVVTVMDDGVGLPRRLVAARALRAAWPGGARGASRRHVQRRQLPESRVCGSWRRFPLAVSR